VKVSIDGESDKIYNIFALQITYPNGTSNDKAIQISGDAGTTNLLQGKYLNVQFTFDSNNNYIYTQVDPNKSEFEQAYLGTASKFSIKDSVSNTDKIIQIQKVNVDSPSSWEQIYHSTGGIKEIQINPMASGTDKPTADNGTQVPQQPQQSGLDPNGQKQIYPSKAGGKFITKHDARYFTRHYASGKPDDPTVEMTIDAGTAFEDQECTCVVQMTGMNHSDTIDWKMRGGVHSHDDAKAGTCYDLELMTDGSAEKTLEVESPHPKNHAAHQPQLFKPGDVSKAKFGWKGICINTKDGKGVHIESWINLTPEDQNGWKKYIDVTDTGQLYKPTSPILKCYGPLATIRIDGIKGKPTFDKVSMREIAWP